MRHRFGLRMHTWRGVRCGAVLGLLPAAVVSGLTGASPWASLLFVPLGAALGGWGMARDAYRIRPAVFLDRPTGHGSSQRAVYRGSITLPSIAEHSDTMSPRPGGFETTLGDRAASAKKLESAGFPPDGRDPA